MTPKERMLIAMKNGKPDMVPCAPDISTMIPMRRTGRPFWDIDLYQNPPLWRAYIDAIKYFGIDGWFIYGYLDFHSDDKIEIKKQIKSQSDERIVNEIIFSTPAGDMVTEVTHFVADPAMQSVKHIKNIRDDFEKFRYFYPEYTGYDSSALEVMRSELGDLGALGVALGYPGFQTWYCMVQGGLDELTCTYYDSPELLEEWRIMQHKQSVRLMELTIDAKPDFILFGGSGSITLQSPKLFREFCLPTIKEMTRMAKEAGVPTMLHSCGKERALVEMCANETDLDCVNPLEIPPMGDCDLAEIKRSFGDKIALMGNLHTTDIMLNGSPDDVERAAIKCIEDAAEGGGFILSTGDQCGRDTPDENIFRMVEVARKYGVY